MKHNFKRECQFQSRSKTCSSNNMVYHGAWIFFFFKANIKWILIWHKVAIEHITPYLNLWMKGVESIILIEQYESNKTKTLHFSQPKYIPPQREGYSYPVPKVRLELPNTYLPPTTTTTPKPIPSTYLPPTTRPPPPPTVWFLFWFYAKMIRNESIYLIPQIMTVLCLPQRVYDNTNTTYIKNALAFCTRGASALKISMALTNIDLFEIFDTDSPPWFCQRCMQQ